MSNTPKVRSYEQINGRMLAAYMSRIGVNDLNTGGAMVSFFEAASQALFRASGDVFQIFRDFSVDRAQGDALRDLAKEERVLPIPARVATGRVTISDSRFERIVTKIYQGTNPPNVGSTSIFVSDASQFTPTGSVYIGRGTANIEGPIAYSSINQVGDFYEIVLTTPTTKFHNLAESVVLAQGGNRTISAGTVVQTSALGSTAPVAFIITKAVTILDGEVEVTNISVAAQAPGTDGNVTANAITDFASIPFTGAKVNNPIGFTTGKNTETDEELRNRIKKARLSKGLGTATAIQASVDGVRSDVDNATVTSSQILRTAIDTSLFFDDGSGYEEQTRGVGLETLVESALGGERFFQLSTGGSQTSVAKAFMKTPNPAPFNLRPNDRLAFLVGGLLSEHVFQQGDFRANGAATAYELVSSINANPNLLFSADTIDDGSRAIFFAKSEINEYMQKTNPTSGNDAGAMLNLPTAEVETLQLFKNDIPLNRNGRSAQLETQNQSDWLGTITAGDTLIVKVDNTSFITYTFTNQDFLSQGTHPTVSATNSLQSWADVINNKVIGVTASLSGTRLTLTSNLGVNNRASLEIDPSSTLVLKGMFSEALGLSAFGLEADYTFNRFTAQIELKKALSYGDKLTVGSENTEGSITGNAILGGSLTLTDTAALWFLVDEPTAQIIQHGVLNNSIVNISKEGGNVLRFQSTLSNAFSAVEEGDYVVMWDENLSVNNRLEGRVAAVGTDVNPDDYFEIRITSDEYVGATNQPLLNFGQGLAFLRSKNPPQKAIVNAGTYSTYNVASIIQSQINDIKVSVVDEEYLVFTTNNTSNNGSVLLFTQNNEAQGLNLQSGDFNSSTKSLFGLAKTPEIPYFPRFIHSHFSSDEYADPSSSFIGSVDSDLDLELNGLTPNEILVGKHPYLTFSSYVEDAQFSDQLVQVNDLNVNTITLPENRVLKRIREFDRYYVLRALDFNASDQLTVILDNNTTERTFPIKMFRNLVTNSGMPNNATQFRAYDADAGSNVEFEQFFGPDFDFSNYKLLMKARNVIDPSAGTDEDAVLIRSANWGELGNNIHVGYFYPTSANQDIENNITVTSETEIRIFLKSGDPVSNTIDGTTEWDVTIVPESPDVDQVTYTWSGTGTNPNLSLAPGHYVTINQAGEFLVENTGTFKVLAENATSFTVRRPSGAATAQNDVATLTNNTITMYENEDTTAEEINEYINDELSFWIVSELINDNGVTGAGIINTSTYEDSDFTQTEYVQLVDGINWILSVDLSIASPNPQFTLKRPLDLQSYSTNTPNAYLFNEGEEARLIPTTINHVKEFANILAVSGYTTLGTIETTNNQSQLELSTNTIGEDGLVRISGGNANSTQGSLLSSASALDNDYMRLSVSRNILSAINVDSVVKIEALNKQAKPIGLSATTQITITPNAPNPNQSIIELDNREINDIYFGEPRNNVRDRGRVFHVEKHGNFTCLSWNEDGVSPYFLNTVTINDALGGDLDVYFDTNTNTTIYEVVVGDINFSEVKAGDTVVFDNLVNSENNGSFRVVGVSEDKKSLSVDNLNGTTETATTIASGDIVIVALVREGDTITIAAPFASANQGQFRIVSVYLDSIYYENPSAKEEVVEIIDNLITTSIAVDTELDVTINGNMVITWNGNGTQPNFSNARPGDVVRLGTDFNINNQGDFTVVEASQNEIVLKNALAVAESNITIADIFEIHRPSMKFFSYDDTVAGDRFVITGNVLGANNVGAHTVIEVLSKTRAVVSGIMEAQSSVQLNGLFTQVYLEEANVYSTYKEIKNVAVNSSNTDRIYLVTDKTDYVNRINTTAGATIKLQGKLGFPERNNVGSDAYKYHTGLMAEVNKTVYGDPRDRVTYPGVAAAGATILHRPPLKRRITMSINVRVQTGIPFTAISEKVRNNIAALVNSTDIGQSIAISDIISTVNSIPGVAAVSITSPQYDPQNDMIIVNQSEKALILDLINDIAVGKVG